MANLGNGVSGSAFAFERGDHVLVRVREDGDSGSIIAKFEAPCEGIYTDRPGSTYARFDVEWGRGASIRLRPYEAEFEVIES